MRKISKHNLFQLSVHVSKQTKKIISLTQKTWNVMFILFNFSKNGFLDEVKTYFNNYLYYTID